ncbi:MAG: hypothetical protein O3A85_12590 [Proteobacteria bacterium]|nr:hypothetical protein [Pseudomonadota bacterium]
MAAIVLGAPVTARAAHCPLFPKVVWWGTLTHATETDTVQRRYDGNWKSAIAAWQKNLAKLMEIQKNGTTAAIRYTSKVNGHPDQASNVKLSGNKLDAYIDNVWKRLAVMYCLADVRAAEEGSVAKRR